MAVLFDDIYALLSGTVDPHTSSENLLDGVDRPVSMTFPDTHRQQAIEERVLRRGRLEARQRAKIVVRVVAHASECHMDQRAVVGLERHPEIELARSIGGRGHPVGAAEDDAAQALAFKGPTGNRKDREHAMRCLPDLLGRGGRKTQTHQRTGVHRVLSVRKGRLKQFMNGVDRTFRTSVSARYGYAMVQECVRGV